jgi:demethylmenaquinone methyltransferase/2-methoxy-6-polyprenyl-1,4-benzoquinol methylase
LGRERQLQARAIAAIGLKQSDTVLDLACGAGVNFRQLRDKVGSSGRIVAVDYSDGMLATARAAARADGWSNIEFRREDAARLELPPASLDGALCTFGLSAMPGETAALRRVAAALKPGAKCVVLDAKAFTGFARAFNPVAGPIFKYTTNWDYEKDVLRAIREAFAEVTIEEYNSGSNFIAVATSI